MDDQSKELAHLKTMLGDVVTGTVREHADASLELAANAAGHLGICVNYLALALCEPGKKTSAVMFLMAGPIPDDLLEGLKNYLKGLLQDYESTLPKTCAKRNRLDDSDDPNESSS